MNRTVQLLSWFWWRHRILLFASVASVILAQAAYWTGVTLELSEEIMAPMLSLLHVSFLTSLGCALTVFAYGADLDLTSGKSSVPRWFHNLPVRSYVLAVVPMLAMIAWLAWAWFPYQFVMIHFHDSESSPRIFEFSFVYYMVLLPALFFFAGGFWIQATSWWPFRFAVFRAIALFAVGYVLIKSAVVILEPVERKTGFKTVFDALVAEGCWQLDALAIGALVLGAAASILSVSVSRQRSTLAESEWNGKVLSSVAELASRTRQAFSPDSPSVNSNFEGPTQAIHWRDWHQLGRFPCWIMLCVAVWAIVSKFGLILFPVAVGLCGFAGTTLGKNKYWKGSKPFPPFLGVLPVSTNTFLRMRYANAVRVSLVCWGIAGAGFLISLLWAHNWAGISMLIQEIANAGEFDAAYSINVLAAFILASFVLAVIAPFPGMVIGLSGRRIIHLAANIALGLGFFASWVAVGLGMVTMQVTMASNEFANDPELVKSYPGIIRSRIFTGLCIVLAAKFVFSAVAIALQVRRGIFRWQAIAKYGSLLAICYLILIGCFWMLLRNTNTGLDWVVLTLAILIPFGSLLMAPVSLDWNRHR